MARIVNRYYLLFHVDNEMKLINEFKIAFQNWNRDISPYGMYHGSYLYAYIYLIDGEDAQLVMGNHGPSITYTSDAIELKSIEDINMLPLMDVGVTAGKKANG
jgi:hypothetical protein